MLDFLKRHKVWVASSVIVLMVAGPLLGLWLATRGNDPHGSGSSQTAASAFGITYVQLTPHLASYYHVGTDHGALVTDVAPGSAAEQAGIRPGDVIISFAGKQLGPDTPLFGLLEDCALGDTVDLEVWHQNDVRPLGLNLGSGCSSP